MVTGLALLGYVQAAVPGLSPEAALRLELGDILCDEDQLAIVCLLSTGLKYIWEARINKKLISFYNIGAEIEASVTILRQTRHSRAEDRILFNAVVLQL